MGPKQKPAPATTAAPGRIPYEPTALNAGLSKTKTLPLINGTVLNKSGRPTPIDPSNRPVIQNLFGQSGRLLNKGDRTSVLH